MFFGCFGYFGYLEIFDRLVTTHELLLGAFDQASKKQAIPVPFGEIKNPIRCLSNEFCKMKETCGSQSKLPGKFEIWT